MKRWLKALKPTSLILSLLDIIVPKKNFIDFIIPFAKARKQCGQSIIIQHKNDAIIIYVG